VEASADYVDLGQAKSRLNEPQGILKKALGHCSPYRAEQWL